MTPSNPSIDVKDATRRSWFGRREEAQLPVRDTARGDYAPYAPGLADATGRPPSVLARALRAVRDIVLVLATLTALSTGLVLLGASAALTHSARVDVVAPAYQGAELARPFALPADPSISPMDAGLALASLQLRRETPEFPVTVKGNGTRSWAAEKMPADLFPGSRYTGWNGPEGKAALDAAAAGATPAQLEFLRAMATAPEWGLFDRFARAPAADLLGGQFTLPFSPLAGPDNIPFVSISKAKELANASIARAAYFLAVGQSDAAEQAIRVVISAGFQMLDNAVHPNDIATGRYMVGLGRDALEQYFTITNDARAAQMPATRPPPSTIKRNADTPHYDGADDLRRDAIAHIADANAPRALRYMSLLRLSLTSCTSVRDLLLGRRPEVRDAFALARRDLARFPSERAYIDLVDGWPDRVLGARIGVDSRSPYINAAATLVGVVLNNPRIPACTRLMVDANALP